MRPHHHAAMVSASSASAASQAQRPNVNPLWRHSNPDSHYGFRQQHGPPANGSGTYRGRYHLPSSGTTPADLSHYSAIPSGKWPPHMNIGMGRGQSINEPHVHFNAVRKN